MLPVSLPDPPTPRFVTMSKPMCSVHWFGSVSMGLWRSDRTCSQTERWLAWSASVTAIAVSEKKDPREKPKTCSIEPDKQITRESLVPLLIPFFGPLRGGFVLPPTVSSPKLRYSDFPITVFLKSKLGTVKSICDGNLTESSPASLPNVLRPSRTFNSVQLINLLERSFLIVTKQVS